MGIFDVKGEPVFLKEDSAAELELDEMRSLLPSATGRARQALERDIKLTEAGIYGEKQVIFQLKNSHMPMFVLHDLYLEHEGLTGQIDFLIVTPRITLVAECKNLVGDIEITDRGDFIRTFNYGHGSVREGMDSPVTQNERHLQLMKAIQQDGRSRVYQLGNDHYFRKFTKSVIVLANSRTVLVDRHAPDDIRSQVIRADALIRHIGELNRLAAKDVSQLNLKEMESAARRWLDRNVEHHRDIAGAHAIEAAPAGTAPVDPSPTAAAAAPEPTSATTATSPSAPAPTCPKCGSPMVLRTATRGERAGKHFWGCSTYPHCHGIINVDE